MCEKINCVFNTIQLMSPTNPITVGVPANNDDNFVYKIISTF